jgi:uncharacterized protein (TIGR00299 family) protein
MNVAYFDCFAGASGDMILGALVDAGLEPEKLRDALVGLPLRDWELRARRVVRGGLAATHVEVIAQHDMPTRRYEDLVGLLNASELGSEVKESGERILRRIAEVESRLHHHSLEEVHLHELGGVDTLVDVIGAVAGLELLNVGAIYVSALPMGSGVVNTRHGTLPLPAPAVVELVRGVPIRAVDIQAELVTPTGAAILTTLAHSYATFPPMTLTHIGYGAGTRELPIPNVLRVLIGAPDKADGATYEPLVMLETNIDDMNPQMYDYVMARLFESGALDVWLTPVQMKKNRAGTLLSVLCPPQTEVHITKLLFEETTTLGVRRREVQRAALARETISVTTEFGPVHVKIAWLEGRVLRAKPEYDDCRKLAEEHHVPLIEVYQAAEAVVPAAIQE